MSRMGKFNHLLKTVEKQLIQGHSGPQWRRGEPIASPRAERQLQKKAAKKLKRKGG